LGGAGELAGAVQAENEQVEDQAVELEDEAGELQSLDNPVIIGVVHILEINNHVILRRHILGYIMIHNQPQEPTQKQQINLLIHLIQLRLEQHQRLPLTHIPHPMQIINPLTELIHQQWWRLRITRLYPVGEEVPLIGFIPEVLVEVGVGDFLQRVDVVAGDEVAVEVHELDADLFEDALGEQVALYAGEGLVGVVVGLLD
jgi:hypothetical protein